MTQPLGGHPQADGRPAHGEVSRAAQLGVGVAKGQGTGRDLIAIGRASLDEPRRPEPGQAGDRRVPAAKRFGEGDRALKRLLQVRG